MNLSANEILLRPRAGWYWTHSHWTADDFAKLRVLAEAKAPLEGSADALGRTPTAIADYARRNGVSLPDAWRMALRPAKRAKQPRAPAVKLQYPYIIRKRDEHADLLAVNALVPRIPGREDVCQEIMLAMWEGRITVEQLRANTTSVRQFITFFRRLNFEQSGYATSMDAPVPGADGLLLKDTFSEQDSLWLH